MELPVAEPQRSWTREQLIAYARDHYGPFAAPGAKFLYSDLNWDLLGLVVRGATGRPFHEVVRERVLDPLGMSRTWYHAFEDPPDGVETDVWRSDALDVVERAVAALIPTLRDLAG